MKVIKTIRELREEIHGQRMAGKKIGFVPTMGFLHQGHLSLVDVSKKYSDYQVMSIFVNKMQFNDPKDFDSYPVDLEMDFKLAKETGVDCMFVPAHEEIYQNNLTYVDINALDCHLCGSTRPGHFRGVMTVVSKLFNIVQPDVSAFGQKDIQQAAIIEKMVADLNFPVKIIVAPTIREKDGLAMSSRNKNLTEIDRKNALSIYRSLQKAETLLRKGERKANVLIDEVTGEIESGGPDTIHYVSVVDYETLAPIEIIEKKAAIAVAAFFGKPRLIDNMIIEIDKNGESTCVY